MSEAQWTSVASYGTSVYRIEAYGTGWVLMQNDPAASYNAGQWTLVRYHTVGAGFGYCMAVYDGANAAAALTADVSAIYNSANATHGCNGYPHTVAS